MALLQRFSFILLFATLIGCGGGDGGLSDGGGDDGGTVDTPIVISLSISDTNVTELSPATITATVSQGTTALEGLLVTFSIDNSSLGFFTPEAGTARTNSDGVASIVLNAGEQAGAGQVTASLGSGESASITFDSQGVTDAVVRIGSGDPFVEGVAGISLSQISAGGTSVVSVSIVDEQGAFFTESVELEFTSVCAEEEVPSSTLSSPVVTTNGQATSTYLAKGCVGDDPITVNAIVNGQNLRAIGTINVLPADVGSVEFVSATPTFIAIQGTGSSERPENSTVVFRVLDTNGNPVNNQDVTFSLSSDTGEIQLNPLSATTNNEGLVQTVVNSGTVARAIRVVAQVTGSDPVIQTLSSELKISTGLPDQDSISLSADLINPEAWDLDGAEVRITARLADAFNNPPPPTTVVFKTEGGSIEELGQEATCVTGGDGSCSVTWRSQYPRPEGHVLGDANNVDHKPEVINTMGQKYGGRVTVTATAIGEESFPDLNGNGRFDVCEVPAFTGGVGKPCDANGNFDESKADIVYSGNDVSGNPYDVGEAYHDYNEDGFFNPGEEDPAEQAGGELEELEDFNKNGLYDPKDGKYNGVLCAIPAHDGCSDVKSIDVRSSIVLVMSGTTPIITTSDPADGVLVIEGESTESATVIIADLHNQPMPAGTKITFDSTVGSVVAGADQDWGNDNHNGGAAYSALIKGEKEPKTGVLTVTVEVPSGAKITYIVANIVIN
ncbi:hypothetical protein [Thalassotalea fusca]